MKRIYYMSDGGERLMRATTRTLNQMQSTIPTFLALPKLTEDVNLKKVSSKDVGPLGIGPRDFVEWT